MTWQEWAPRTRPRTTVPALSIQANGSLAWNKGLHDKLGEPTYVRVMHDADGQRLAIRAAERTMEAFTVHRTGRQKSWHISAAGAVKAYMGGLPERAYRRYAEEFEPGVWGIVLDALVIKREAEKAN